MLPNTFTTYSTTSPKTASALWGRLLYDVGLVWVGTEEEELVPVQLLACGSRIAPGCVSSEHCVLNLILCAVSDRRGMPGLRTVLEFA